MSLSFSHIRLRYDFNQWDAGSVIIHQGNILPFIMYQLSRILLHVDFMNSYFLPPGRRFDFHAAVLADGEVELGNLIVLRIVGVKIVLPVESAEPGNGTAGGKANSHGIFHHLLIQYGIPVQTGQVWVLGAPPKAVEQPQKILVRVASST